MDRNSVIGFSLLGLLLVGYIFFNTKQQKAAELAKARQDSIVEANKPKVAGPDTTTLQAGVPDSAKLAGQYGAFAGAATGTAQKAVLENKVLKITFSSQGGQPETVELKAFKTFVGSPLMLVNSSFNRISLEVPANNNSLLNTADLFFTGGNV